MIGSPLPCGVVVTKKEYTAQIGRAIEYVGALDTTLLGSRNAFTPMIIWYSLKKHGRGRLSPNSGTDARYRRVCGAAVSTPTGLRPGGTGTASTVRVPASPHHTRSSSGKLAPLEDIAHLITMPHVTREMVDQVIADCLEWPGDQT